MILMEMMGMKMRDDDDDNAAADDDGDNEDDGGKSNDRSLRLKSFTMLYSITVPKFERNKPFRLTAK